MVQAHPKAARWRKTSFPFNDEMYFLVDGIIATGAGAFHAGSQPQIISRTPNTHTLSQPQAAQAISSPLADHINTAILQPRPSQAPLLSQMLSAPQPLSALQSIYDDELSGDLTGHDSGDINVRTA
jgi:hypothetical protein